MLLKPTTPPKAKDLRMTTPAMVRVLVLVMGQCWEVFVAIFGPLFVRLRAVFSFQHLLECKYLESQVPPDMGTSTWFYGVMSHFLRYFGRARYLFLLGNSELIPESQTFVDLDGKM